MGDNTLNQVSAPAVASEDDVNQYYVAVTGNHLPRDPVGGAPQGNMHSLGRPATQWQNAYVQNLFLNGQLFDPTAAAGGGDTSNAIVSGRTRTESEQPDFIRASGSGTNATILATDVPLQITANAQSVTISTDIPLSSLSVAPSADNTCLVNDSGLTGLERTKYTGEHPEDPLTIDNAGSEITDRVGQYVCLMAGTEYMFAFVKSETELTNIKRGFFFDSSGNPVVREVLNNNNTLTLMSLGWVFAQSDGTTTDISYKSPIYSASEPASPDLDDYWFDQVNLQWKRYNDTDFIVVDRMLIGLVVINQTDCVASRSFDFTKGYGEHIEIEVESLNETIIQTKNGFNSLSVYGSLFQFNAGPIEWDITQNLETGLTESASTLYHLYITEQGGVVISEERPYNRMSDLRGWYHPYHSWRYVGVAYNDSSSNFSNANSLNSLYASRTDTYFSSGEFLPIPNRSIKTHVQGGGGGGVSSAGGSPGSNGGTSSIGGLNSASGGGGGSNTAPGNGGGASGGDIHITGGGGGSATKGVATGQNIGGAGGGSFFSSPAFPDNGTDRRNGSSRGGGGSGQSATSGNINATGGGGGGCSIGIFHNVSERRGVTVGGGGNGGQSNQGGRGSGGIVTIEYL